VRPEGLGELKNLYDVIGTRTRELPACSLICPEQDIGVSCEMKSNMVSPSGRGVLRQEVFSTKLTFNIEDGSCLGLRMNDTWGGESHGCDANPNHRYPN
jgi:hypothetical protein